LTVNTDEKKDTKKVLARIQLGLVIWELLICTDQKNTYIIFLLKGYKRFFAVPQDSKIK
jgi:hypothetical protein